MRQLLSLDVQIQNAIVNSLPIIPSFPTEFLLAWGTAFWLPLSTLLKLCLLTTEALLWWWVLIVLHENQLLPKRSEWLFNLYGRSVGLVLDNIWADKSFRSANHLFILTQRFKVLKRVCHDRWKRPSAHLAWSLYTFWERWCTGRAWWLNLH